MSQSSFESPLVPTELADAPDIDNVPAASSMHALMEAVVEMHHDVRQMLAAVAPAGRPGGDVANPDATPAPLDPAKVKAGDTVTLESGTALVRDVVIRTKSRGNGQHLFYTGESPDPIAAGVFYIVGPGAWTLTDHQPAPEKSPREQVVDILIDYTNTRADDYDTADQIIAALGPDEARALRTVTTGDLREAVSIAITDLGPVPSGQIERAMAAVSDLYAGGAR